MSSALTGLAAVTGEAVEIDQKAFDDEAGSPSPLTRRRFRLTPARVIRGDQAVLADADCVFEGFTLVQQGAAKADPRSPTLFLDGQRFFDEPQTPGLIPVMVLIGDPPPSPPMGFGGRTSRVAGGRLDGVAVRPFRLTGADRNLADAMPSLVGWRGQSDAASQAAIVAEHPLVPLDALRLEARRELRIDAVEGLATVLLHPTQAPQATVLTLGILRKALRSLPPGSQEAERLLRLTAWNWRLERSQAVEVAYLETWLGAVDQLLASAIGEELRALATDVTGLDRVSRLRSELARLLSRLRPRNG